MGKIQQIDEQEDFAAALKNAGSKLVVVDFFATWCGPCKVIAPKLEIWNDDYAGVVVFLKVDVDENNDTAEAYEVSAMPTFLFFKNGEKVDTLVGANEKKLLDMITKHK